MLDRDDELHSACQEVVGAGVARELFSSGHLARVVGVELDDRRQAVLKVRPSSPRLDVVVRTQRYLHDAGVPCPRPLAGPVPFDDHARVRLAWSDVASDVIPRA